MFDVLSGRDAPALLRLATRASVVTAALLIAAKLGAWAVTGSVAVLASLVDSLMDAAASLINLAAVHYSLKPPDAEHRFGHGKAEALAGLAQSAFIAGSSAFLLLNAVDRILHPQPLQQLGAGMLVMLFSMAATLALVALQRQVIRRTGSTAVKADSLHYATDLLTNGAVLIGLFLAGAGWPGADPLFALGVAFYVLYSAWQIMTEALDFLLDREAPPAVRDAIRAAVLEDAGVRGVHDLRTRGSGRILFVQLHLEVDGGMPLGRAHALGDAAERRILRQVPEAQVLIHFDPVDVHPGG